MNNQATRNGLCDHCGLPLDHCSCFTVGDQVRFREVLDPGDEECVFDVIVENSYRVMIRLICDLPIRPVKIVRRADVCKTNEIQTTRRTTTVLDLDATDEEIQKALDALQNESSRPTT
jgi:hypothetical protein